MRLEVIIDHPPAGDHATQRAAGFAVEIQPMDRPNGTSP
jgi:hypothetical protein